MSKNDRNIPGINIDNIVGTVGTEAQAPAYDKQGTSGVLEVSVAVNQGYRDKASGEWKDTGTVWVTVSAAGDYANALKDYKKGDRIRIDGGTLEAREFTRKDGSAGQAFTVRYGTTRLVQRKGESSGGGSGFDSVPEF